MNKIPRRVLKFIKKEDLLNQEFITKDQLLEVISEYGKKIKEEQDSKAVLKNIIRQSSKDMKDYLKNLDETRERMISSSKMAAVGEMAANISHEINNPLMVIQSASFLVNLLLNQEENISKENKESIEKSLLKIKITTEKIAHIISSLKIISRNNEALQVEKIKIEEIVIDACSFFEENFKNLKIKFDYSKKMFPAEVWAAQTELSQVLVNLITNAKHAIENLEEKNISIELKKTENHLIISVINSGPPIDPGIRAKIFESFFTTKDVGVGTGLGLSVSRKIMIGMGGKLYLDEAYPSPKFDIVLNLVK